MVEKLIQRTMNVITNENKWKNQNKRDKFDGNCPRDQHFPNDCDDFK